jgi:hypothetical protein
MALFKRSPRVTNIEEYHRLPVIITEPALREKLPSKSQLEEIRDAKEYLFQETADIRRVDNRSNP